MRALLAVALLVTVSHCCALTLAKDGIPSADIILAANAKPAEVTAASELAHYLGLMCGGEFAVKTEPEASALPNGIYVGSTAKAAELGINAGSLPEEQWVIRVAGNALVLVGGGHRGTIYAAYRLLEEELGVHWWNPWEETVPDLAAIGLPDDLNLTGRPAFPYRDIYMLYGNDKGACAARNRLNRDGDAKIAPEYGGCMDYGPPYHVHTFYMYFPPERYFATHPEWFSLINGKREHDHKQLCLTNPELRRAFLEKLHGFIRATREEAAAKGAPPPLVFSISQNDWGGQCQCDDCKAIAESEESEAGPLLDFVNSMADAIRDEYPDVFIDTLAYMYSQKPPKHIRARDNVIIRLCDTNSNATKPITSEENTKFREFLQSWAMIAKNLRIWDYAVTYAPPQGLPYPSAHTFQPDYQFYLANNVEGVFTEHEYPITSDMHDLKAWLMMKLLEDPYRDYDELLATFTDGFYGPAGSVIREYLDALEKACDAKGSYIAMSPGPSAFSFVDLNFATKAQAMFDRAEGLVEGDETLLRRVRHARLPLDRACVVLFRNLTSEWARRGYPPETVPLDRDAIAQRAKETRYAQAELRMTGGGVAAEKAAADGEMAKYASIPAFLPLPGKFRDLPAGSVFDFTADMTRNWRDIVKVVKDPEAESGITNRLEFPAPVDPVGHALDKYKLPMPWGLYQPSTGKFSYSQSITADAVPGPGYHWYKMAAPQKIRPTYYLYFFWSWIIQLDIDSVIDPENPDQEYDIWARIKFEGPAFPHGKEGDKNAVSVERVVLVKHGAGE